MLRAFESDLTVNNKQNEHMTVHARSLHTGSFPSSPPHNRRSSWKNRAGSIIDHVSRRLSSTKSPFAVIDDHDQIDQVISELTPKELETAARTNYSYLIAPDDQHLREASIRSMVQRVLRSKNHSIAQTIETLRDTLAFRQSIDVDALRLAFSNPVFGPLSQNLYRHLKSRTVYVQGYDKDGRSTHVFEPRFVSNSQDELDWTIRLHVYTLERALACTKSMDKKVNAVVNFEGFSVRKHKPPMDLGVEFMQTLRNHYAGHVNEIFLVDPPRTFLCMWTILSPFLATKTKKRIHFVSGNTQKRRVIGQHYSEDQAPAWMLPGGRLNQALNPKLYLYDTPFDRAFAEEF